ncbi:MAG: T9SS type A sorting domain-containing protein [Ignavibacteria bacterium]|nr:T9SS type A sorting domain-containing protein [Ignavibacteria bacterium]
MPGPILVTLSGYAFNHPVTYNYTMNLIDSVDGRYQFLTKIWAKQKIEYLLVLYYALNPNDPAAIALKNQIIQLSIAYGVISPFTSFGVITGQTNNTNEVISETYKLAGNYPNPFNPVTTIKLLVNKAVAKTAYIRIYNVLGQLVNVIPFEINGKGIYEIKWNGMLSSGQSAPSGVYFYVIDLGDQILKSKMVLLK